MGKSNLIHILAICLIQATYSFAQESQESKKSFKELLIKNEEEKITALRNKRLNSLKSLRDIKYYIISGNMPRAKRQLRKLRTYSKSTSEVKKRYEFIIKFIEGDFESIERDLKQNKYSLNPHLKKFCGLKILFSLGKKDIRKVSEDLLVCLSAVGDDSPTDMAWIREFVTFFQSGADPKYITRESFFLNATRTEESTFLWLKFVLYYGVHKEASEILYLLGQNMFDNPRIRELIGLIFYRAGDIEKAKLFVENIELANAYNIRGNIALDTNEYVLAYGLFNLALNKKSDSLNAIRRAIPLSWLNKDSKKGLELLYKSQSISEKNDGYLLYQAAIFSRQNEHKKALKILEFIKYKYNNYTPEVLGELLSYNYLNMNEQLKASKFALDACKKYDLMNCYLLSALFTWDNLGKTIRRQEPVFDENMEADLFSTIANGKIESIKEDIYIDQKDILELDERDKDTFLNKLY